MSRVKSRAGRIALTILLLFVATLIVMVPVGILGSSNVVWGEDNQYGRVDVPGTAVLHLPAGSLRVSAAVEIPGRGNETPNLPLPSDLALAVTPVRGSAQPTVTRDLGTSANASDDQVNAQRQVWTVHVPSDGAYRVTARGNFLGVGVNAQLWFGHGPPLPGTLVPLVAVGIVLISAGLWLLVHPRLRGRRRTTAAAAGGGGGLSSAPTSDWEPAVHRRATADDSVGRLERLADLHERGALTDAEFVAEKARVIGETESG